MAYTEGATMRMSEAVVLIVGVQSMPCRDDHWFDSLDDLGRSEWSASLSGFTAAHFALVADHAQAGEPVRLQMPDGREGVGFIAHCLPESLSVEVRGDGEVPW